MALSLSYIERIVMNTYKSNSKKNKGFAQNFGKEQVNLDSVGNAGIVWSEEMEQQCREEAEKFKNTLVSSIQKHISSFDPDAISIDFSYKGKGDKRVFVAAFKFNTKSLWRDSLYTSKEEPAWERYSSSPNVTDVWGTNNIVLQFEKGWTARGSIKGIWHGKEVWSTRARKGSFMLYRAFKRFNSTHHKNATAELFAPYK